MSEKKKGFWSWLGFGKKDESQSEQIIQQENEVYQPQEVEPSLTEKIEDKVEQLEEQFEEKSEQLEDYLEQKRRST